MVSPNHLPSYRSQRRLKILILTKLEFWWPLFMLLIFSYMSSWFNSVVGDLKVMRLVSFSWWQLSDMTSRLYFVVMKALSRTSRATGESAVIRLIMSSIFLKHLSRVNSLALFAKIKSKSRLLCFISVRDLRIRHVFLSSCRRLMVFWPMARCLRLETGISKR